MCWRKQLFDGEERREQTCEEAPDIGREQSMPFAICGTGGVVNPVMRFTTQQCGLSMALMRLNPKFFGSEEWLNAGASGFLWIINFGPELLVLKSSANGEGLLS